MSFEARKAGGAGAFLLGVLLAAALAPPAAQADPANFAGASADGSKVFFTSTDKLVPGDTDRGFTDVYERSYDSEPGIETYVTRELSTGPTGGNDSYQASYLGASTDGRFVFFSTEESLVEGDRDHAVDIYMRDTTTGATRLVSRAAALCASGGCGNGSADATFRGATPGGGRVFFQTTESLSPEDTDEAVDVYMRNLEAEPPTTTLVSRAAVSCASGGCGNGPEGATFAGASANGEEVFFETKESLASNDGDSGRDIYVRDLSSGPTTALVSTAGTCFSATASDCWPTLRSVSADGSRAFFTTSESLTPNDEDNGASDVYVWEGGLPELVSTGPAATNDPGAPATFAGSRAGGGKLFFQTTEKLTSEDVDGAADVYMRDLEAEPPTTTLVSQGDPSCEEAGTCGDGSANETFAGATPDGGTAFLQTSEKLAPNDADGSIDVYARDLTGTTTLVSQAAPSCETGGCGNGPEEAVFAGASANGSEAIFSTKESLVPADEDEAKDIYVRDTVAGSTVLESSPAGICPLVEEKGCSATFAGISEDGSRVFFSTVGRLAAEDVDSDSDLYERAHEESRWITRLVSAGNSVALGPPTPTLTAISPGSSGETLTPSVRGHAAANTTIKVYRTPDCSGTPVTGTVAALEGSGIAVTVEAERQTSLSATATDEGEITSGCSNVLDYTQEYAIPPPGGEGGGGEGGSGESGGSASAPASPSPALGGSSGGAGGSGGSGGSGGIVYVTPVTRITFGPAFKTRARRPVFRFTDSTGQPGTRFICRVDRRRWEPCDSPIRLEDLSRGRHVFRVKAVNAVGVWEAAPSKRVFKLVGGGGNRRHMRHRMRGLR